MDWWRIGIISWSTPSKLPWSQKMCCLLPAEGKGQSIVCRVYPKFSIKHSADSVWESTNLVAEGFIQHVCTLHSLGFTPSLCSGLVSLSHCWAVLNQDTEAYSVSVCQGNAMCLQANKDSAGVWLLAGN